LVDETSLLIPGTDLLSSIMRPLLFSLPFSGVFGQQGREAMLRRMIALLMICGYGSTIMESMN
jgi:hypothetical protein